MSIVHANLQTQGISTTMLTEIFLKVVVTIIVTLLVFFGKKIWWVTSGLYSKYLHDLPDLAGSWETHYQEKDSTGSPVVMTEKVKLKQAGRLVWGEVVTNSRDTREYKFSGHILGTTLIASHWGKERRRAVGSCVFMLRIHSNNKSMKGECIWHDYDSDLIESSEYVWTNA